MPKDNPSLFNKEVEITIVPKQPVTIKKTKASEFVKKWAGVLSVDEVEETKYQYLKEKHQ